MSREVYIINLFIGIGTFFILNLILRRIVKTNKLRMGLTWVGTIILTPVIYVGLTTIFFSALFYQPTKDFDRDAWFAEKDNRFEMMDDIVESEILKDKNKQEIINLIGPPDFKTDTTNIWNYNLGTSGAGLGWQFNALLVTFDNDRVVKVEKQEIVD